MNNAEQYIFKFRKRPQVFAMIHFVFFLSGMVFFVSSFNKENGLFFLLLSLGACLANILIFNISNYFDFNSYIYFDQEIIYQKIKGEKYFWKWDDLISFDLRVLDIRTPAIAVLVFSATEKELRFEYTIHRERILLKKCPNEKAKYLLQKAIDQWN